DGSVGTITLGLDPSALPPVPAVTPAHPGTTNVSTQQNEFRQLCPGRYGAISVGINSTLNLNGGTYEVTRLNLADGARLLPSEPVVILVSGGMTTGIGAIIGPYFSPLPTPVTAANIRIEVSGAITLGGSNQVEAHLLAPTGKLTTGTDTKLFGAAWAKTINIGSSNTIVSEDMFAAHTPKGLATCDDKNSCTTDRCVSNGASGSCKY